jgi:hypothetical protein
MKIRTFDRNLQKLIWYFVVSYVFESVTIQRLSKMDRSIDGKISIYRSRSCLIRPFIKRL